MHVRLIVTVEMIRKQLLLPLTIGQNLYVLEEVVKIIAEILKLNQQIWKVNSLMVYM